jgi:surface antigen
VPDPIYLGYAGKRWSHDYGVLEGRCDRNAVSGVVKDTRFLAPVAAAAAKPPPAENRQVATVEGEILGGPSAAIAGRDMGESDRACLGQALELAGAERTVAWSDPERGIVYRMIPLGGFAADGRSCREFVTRVLNKDRGETIRHRACSNGNGVWQVIG